jgi:hypothetical protein
LVKCATTDNKARWNFVGWDRVDSLGGETDAILFLFNYNQVQKAITETRYFDVIFVSRISVTRKNQRGTRPVQLKNNHGNQVFFRDIRITDFRDRQNQMGICLVQFNDALHTIGQGGVALS